MPLVLDQFPYPWADRTAQQLHVTLTKLHPTPAGAVMVAQQAGIDIAYLNAQQPPVFVWHDILDLAAQGGITRALVTTVRDLLNPQNPQRTFLRQSSDGEPDAHRHRASKRRRHRDLHPR